MGVGYGYLEQCNEQKPLAEFVQHDETSLIRWPNLELGHDVKVISMLLAHTYLDFKVVEYMQQLRKCYTKMLSLQVLALNWYIPGSNQIKYVGADTR